MSATSETTGAYSRQHSDRIAVDNRPAPAARREAALVEMRVALGVGVLGIPIAFAGAIAFLFRVKLAELFLGANVWFNTPVTDTDALKVLFMTIQILGTIAWGTFMTGVAFVFAFLKWTQAQAMERKQQS